MSTQGGKQAPLMSMLELVTQLQQQWEARRSLGAEMVGQLYPSILAREMQVLEACHALMARHLDNGGAR